MIITFFVAFKQILYVINLPIESVTSISQRCSSLQKQINEELFPIHIIMYVQFYQFESYSPVLC